MALSSQWSQSVVVRADRSGGEVVQQHAPTNGTARMFAASGNPIIVRPRDPRDFTAAPSSSSSGAAGGGGGGGASRALITAIVGADISETFWVPDATRNETGLLETLHRRGASNRTFLLLQSRPLPELQCNFSTCTGMNIDLSHNAFRLSKTAMALQRMDAQLGDRDDSGADDYGDAGAGGGGGEYEEFVDDATGAVYYQAEDGNFYPVEEGGAARGRRGRRTAQRQGGGGGNITMSAKHFKSTMRASLQSLQEEDYYLVRYRDYSAWATRHYGSIARSDTLFGRRYVEQCFAVHVGREPGELIPITEAQFLFGVDVLQRQLLNQLDRVPPAGGGGGGAGRRAGDSNRSSYTQYQVDINYSALNADQFNSLGSLLGDGMRPVGVEFEEQKRAAEEEEARRRGRAPGGAYSFYDPPAWYDWTPGAIRRRVRHQLETYYVSVGRLAVQLTVLGIVGFFAYRSVKEYIPSLGGSSNNDNNDNGRDGRRGEGGRGSGRRSNKTYLFNDGDDGEYEYVRRGLLRSVLMGPREVLDYMLAPVDD